MGNVLDSRAMRDGGLDGSCGDAVRMGGDIGAGDGVGELPKMEAKAGRDLNRPAVGKVKRSAAVLFEGVEGRVGGTTQSCMILLTDL